MNRKDLLMAKARGIVMTVEKMGTKERMHLPQPSFGENYNVLRQQVLDHFPQLSEILPPPANIVEGMSGRFVPQNYAEIAAHCEEIFQMLGAVDH